MKNTISTTKQQSTKQCHISMSPDLWSELQKEADKMSISAAAYIKMSIVRNINN